MSYVPHKKFGGLSNCRYCADRAQNLPEPAPNIWLTLFQISSKWFTFGGVITERVDIINKYIHNKWQQTWNSQTQNKLYQIYPTIPSYSTLSSLSPRKYQIIYNRLRIGHTRLTHSYLIEQQILQNVQTVGPNQLLSVKHILTECSSYDQAQHQYYSFTDIKNIFNLTPSQNILNFI